MFQMSPLSWINLMFYFLFIFILFISINYFYLNIKFTNKYKKTEIKSLTWKW